MNNQTKILLNIQGIKGRTLHFLGKKKVKWSITKGDIDHKYKGKDANKAIREGYIKVPVTEELPCQQTIKMTYDAYDYFTSGEAPAWYHGSWKKLTRRQRLEAHLQRACEDRGGTSYTYSVLED